MKIAISSSGNDLNAAIDPRFGRCAYFILVETEDMSFEAFDNENIALGGGAGIQSAQFVASKGAKAVITGNCGPNAVRTLNAAGTNIIVGQSGTVREVVEKYKKGLLDATSEANVSDHYGSSGASPDPGTYKGSGMGSGMGRRGMSGGMGRGGGMGCGRGMGGGGKGSGWNPAARPQAVASEDDEELSVLKKQAEELRRQIESIESRRKKPTLL
ncbi:MAG: NifB/NifX family molybdenum-iron cluster-binding protein [Desulfatiglandaceae bacterium]